MRALVTMGCGVGSSEDVDDEGVEDGPVAHGVGGDRDLEVDVVGPFRGAVDGDAGVRGEAVSVAAAGVGDRGVEGEDGVRGKSLVARGTRRAECVGGGGTSASAVLRSGRHGLYAQPFVEVPDGPDRNGNTPSSK